jgi:hypothetical protein
MTDSNFFGYIIAGMGQLFSNFLQSLPPSTATTMFDTAVTLFYFSLAPIMFLVGNFVDLWIVIPVVTLIIGLEGAQFIWAAWRFFLKTIPAFN